MKKLLAMLNLCNVLVGAAQLNANDLVGPAPIGTAPPTLIAPRRIIVPCQGPNGAMVEFNAAIPGTPATNTVIECVPPSGTVFPVGTNVVTCTGMDEAGVPISAMFPVIVVGGCATDNCLQLQLPANITTPCTSASGAKVTFTAAATNRCSSGTADVTCLPATGSQFPVGTTRVVCTARSGEKHASASFTIEVTDNTPPEIHCLEDQTVEAQSPLGAVVRYEVTAKDDCTAQVRVRCSPPSGTVFKVGQTRVFCQAADGHGNASSCTFTVKVNPAAPLRVTRMGTKQIELRWTGDSTLEGTEQLTDDSLWKQIVGTPKREGVDRILDLPATAPYRYFRVQPMPLMPPPDQDGDGVPDNLDHCSSTPHGLAVDDQGVALLEIVSTPEDVLGAERDAAAKTVTVLQRNGHFPELTELLQTRLAESPVDHLRARDLAAAWQVQSNLVAGLLQAVDEFPGEKALRIAQLQREATLLNEGYGDLRPEDIEIIAIDEIEAGLKNSLKQSQHTLATLANLRQLTSGSHSRERVRIASIDANRGTAQLDDGRLLLLPHKSGGATPPLSQLPGPFVPGNNIDLEVAPLPDGSLFGFDANPPVVLDSSFNLSIDLTCLRLRVAPADPGLPGFDVGPHHDLHGYKWGFSDASSRHYLEYGMALVIDRIACPFEAPGAYDHWLDVKEDTGNIGIFTFMIWNADDTSTPFVLKPGRIQPGVPFPLLVREYRRSHSTGQVELLKEETLILEVNTWAYYADATYDRNIFELEDWPNETHYQTAQVVAVDRQWPLYLQPLDQQTFIGQGYGINGQGSTYPNAQDVHLNEPFAVHFQDPNNDMFFAYTNDVGRGLYAPTINGLNHNQPFTYRVNLPSLVRDRLHDCGTDSYYRIPYVGPIGLNVYGDWQVSQGNNGTFTHKGSQAYAFDFPNNQGTFVLACRGGIVIGTNAASSKSCYDPNLDNGPGKKKGGCTNCTGNATPNFVSILHQDGTIGVYMHFVMNGVLVTPGQRIYRGDPIGKTGSTGCSTDPHVHVMVFEPTGKTTIPIRFESYDANFVFRSCYLPPSNSVGFSTNKPWYWPF